MLHRIGDTLMRGLERTSPGAIIGTLMLVSLVLGASISMVRDSTLTGTVIDATVPDLPAGHAVVKLDDQQVHIVETDATVGEQIKLREDGSGYKQTTDGKMRRELVFACVGALIMLTTTLLFWGWSEELKHTRRTSTEPDPEPDPSVSA